MWQQKPQTANTHTQIFELSGFKSHLLPACLASMQFYLKALPLRLLCSRRVSFLSSFEYCTLFDIGQFYESASAVLRVHAFHILLTTFYTKIKLKITIIINGCNCYGLNSLFSLSRNSIGTWASDRTLITQRRRRTFYRIPIKSHRCGCCSSEIGKTNARFVLHACMFVHFQSCLRETVRYTYNFGLF